MNAVKIIIAFCAESSVVGRVEYSSMGDQTLMELLVSNMKGQSSLKDNDGDFLDISEWHGVKIDNDGKVLKIDFEHEIGMDLFDVGDSDSERDNIPHGGSIDLRWLPDSITKFSVNGFKLEGTIATDQLPRSITYLDVTSNKFTGEFCMEALPKGIQIVHIDHNRLHGTLNLSADLPNLRVLAARDNMFTGTLDMSGLPKGIRILYVGGNKFSAKTIPEEVRKSFKELKSGVYCFG